MVVTVAMVVLVVNIVVVVMEVAVVRNVEVLVACSTTSSVLVSEMVAPIIESTVVVGRKVWLSIFVVVV